MICKECGKEFIEWRKDKGTIRKQPVALYCSLECTRRSANRKKDPRNTALSAGETIKCLCGRSAKYKTSSGEYICSEYSNQCPSARKKISLGLKKAIESGWAPKSHVHLKKEGDRRGGYRRGGGRGKHGWYKGIWCDSTWELAFVIYHLDHNIPVERCKEKRFYMWNGEKRIYHPDFLVNNFHVVEVKGYESPQWLEKYKANPDVEVIDREGIKKYIEYTKQNYGKDLISLFEER